MITDSSSDRKMIWIIVASTAIAAVGVLIVWIIGLTLYSQIKGGKIFLKGYKRASTTCIIIV